MSHTTTLKTVAIRDIPALLAAVQELKQKGVSCDLVQNERPRMYYQDQHGKCDYVLRLHSSQYDVGFDKQEDGTYAPVFDEWSTHISGAIGAGAACPLPNTPEGKAQHAIGQFMQSYVKNATVNAAVAQGYMVESSTIDRDGNVHLTLGNVA